MATSPEQDKLWGGRFHGKLNETMERFNASIGFDKRLYKEDIQGSIAYAKALQAAGLITKDECDTMVNGLDKVLGEWEKGQFEIKHNDEDIHTANERRLKELIGDEIGGKLHTGRSRNDQVATDMRLWLRNAENQLKKLTVDLIESLVTRASKEKDVIMPGYTHLQRAQPILWSHYMLSFAWAFKTDVERLEQAIDRHNLCPLGSGALAGNPFHVDRDKLAKELGFKAPTLNSLQAVSDRDFILEFNSWATFVSLHLTKMAEDLIIYSTKEFDFVEIDDAYSTGSSLMPQKKNADSLELIRGKSGRVIGNLIGLMMVLKGLPSTFNKDLQEDKEGMFDTYDTIEGCIEIMTGVIQTLKLNKEKCRAALSTDMLATDVAYYLVRKGVPFRKAHEIAGRVVAEGEAKSMSLKDIPLARLKEICDKFEEDVAKIWDYQTSVDQYVAYGGTAAQSVTKQITELNTWLQKYKSS